MPRLGGRNTIRAVGPGLANTGRDVMIDHRLGTPFAGRHGHRDGDQLPVAGAVGPRLENDITIRGATFGHRAQEG
jgi:hypothetical protein